MFIGRQTELDALEQRLGSPEATGASICGARAGLQGMGGVGKTALALVLAHRLKDRYPDAQLFINLSGADLENRPPITPLEAMQGIIHCFRPGAELPGTLEALSPIYFSVLAEGRILLLLDNASDVDQVKPLLPPPKCCLLVTSREQFFLPGMETCKIDCLSTEKSTKLLLHLAPRLGTYSGTAAELCGGLPLALEVFASVVHEQRLYSVPELLDRLRAENETLSQVDATFQVSYDLLPEQLRKRWCLLAVFPANFDARAAKAVWTAEKEPKAPADSPDARDSLQVLFRASLLEWNETNGRFRLHDLVRKFCKAKLTESELTAVQIRHATHYAQIFAEAEEIYQQGGNGVRLSFQIFDCERGHLESAFDFLEMRQSKEYARLLLLVTDGIGSIGWLRFLPAQIIRWREAQLKAARLIDHRQGEGAILFGLGNAYHALGETRKAIELHEQALVIARESGHRRGEGNPLLGLGNANMTLGEAHKAVEFYEQTRVIAREFGDRPNEGYALLGLGNANMTLGETRKAIDFYEQALVIARELGDRRGEGTAIGSLASTYTDLGDAGKAIGFHQQALVIAREFGDRRAECTYLCNLGSAYNALGEAGKAIGFHQQALALAREIGYLTAEGNSLGGLGNAYLASGETRKAIEFYEQALVIAREAGDQRGEGISLLNSAIALDALGQRQKATSGAEAALRLFVSIEHPSAAKVRALLVEWGRS